MSSGIITDPAQKICDEILAPLLEENKQKILVIGIDGPTAAGKTIFADCMAERLRSFYKRDCWTYRFDWNLAPREARVRDLENLVKRREEFPLEGELHMRLKRAEDFLTQVRSYNEELEFNQQAPGKNIRLEELYSRTNGGKTTGSEECRLFAGMVILVEGHYTLRSSLNNFIDYNILLLGDKAELLSRKVARVQGYRGAQEAEDYFTRVDLPSFCKHLMRFGFNADLVLDNTNYQDPKIRPAKFVDQWLDQNALDEKSQDGVKPVADFKELVERILTNSLMVGEDLPAALAAAFEFILEWDNHISQYLRLSVEDIGVDLISLSIRLIEDLNAQFKSKEYHFCIKHTNTLYNVYNRTLPITIGISIEGLYTVNVLIDVFHDYICLQVTWAGGYYRFHIERKLGQIAQAKEYSILDKTPRQMTQEAAAGVVRVFTPTFFTIPSFLRDFSCQWVFSGHEAENISASQSLSELADQGGVWIHRFAKFSELNFFLGIIENIGGTAVKAGNYLIVVFSKNEDLNMEFKRFRAEWVKRVSDRVGISEDENNLDNLVEQERKKLNDIIQKDYPDFLVIDGYLHCSKISHDQQAWQRLIDQIESMLNSDFRLLRKRAVQFIQRYFPDLSLEVSKLWDQVPPEGKPYISLDALVSISPTILAEIYLWLALRDERAALLGATVYDIRSSSIDAAAYLEAASRSETAIILQSSLNALGQKEKDGEQERYGYLQPENGVEDLVAAVMTAARDMVLVEGKTPPLFGIGIDHVDVTNDRPSGRAKRFLQQAIRSQCVTHYVLDGSGLFNGQHKNLAELKATFEDICSFAIGLLDKNVYAYIYDKEICSGALNYTGGSTKAKIPTIEDMQLFIKILREKLRSAGFGAQNMRPTLFIGNLGTTHHGLDSGDVPVENARLWRDRLKRDNFVSAVLHGTTGTHPLKLEQATAGCHKINVAGDFLETFLKALPERLQDIIYDNGKEPKRMIPVIRQDMDQLSAMEINDVKESLQARCRSVIDTINSPSLKPLDIEYFRYKNYKFSQPQVRVICEAILEQVKSYVDVERQRPADPYAGYEFSASMIEVPFDEKYEQYADTLWEAGIRYFHVDAGDGKFVPREFSGIKKAAYLREKFPEAVLHCHLMVENPHFRLGRQTSVIEQYVQAGCNAVAIHRRSFKNERFFFAALKLIRQLGARPGLIIETTETLDMDMENLIEETELDWAVVMGVPVGYGGQIFDMSTLKRISWLHQFAVSRKKPFLIEMDGGLTMENLSLCRRSGAQIFSGWTIVKADTPEGVRKKVRQVQKIIF